MKEIIGGFSTARKVEQNEGDMFIGAEVFSKGCSICLFSHGE
ncbi:hypothetical protein P4V33_17550 [Brevibacillus borstelensis]|nr:hypothetical protein [Brevibacillus borstelensis]MED1853473.1 hypothetical protein [Brevibacillus borstelensis]